MQIFFSTFTIGQQLQFIKYRIGIFTLKICDQNSICELDFIDLNRFFETQFATSDWHANSYQVGLFRYYVV